MTLRGDVAGRGKADCGATNMETWIMSGRTNRQKMHVARKTHCAARPFLVRLEERLALSNANVTGLWQGTLTQPANDHTYNFDLDLIQTQTSVTGTAFIQVQNLLTAIGECTLTGSVSANAFTFQEQTPFLINDPQPGYGWLALTGSLAVSANGDLMAGTSTYGGSVVGPISLTLVSSSPVSIIPTNLAPDPTRGGVDFSDQVKYEPGYDTQVALYWSSTPEFSGAIGGPFDSRAIAKATAVGTYGPFNVPQSDLTPPPGANYLLAVTDPADVLGNFDPDQSVLALATTSTAAASTSTTFSPASQTVPLSATVTSAAGIVDEGTETFSILSGTKLIGSAVTVDVGNGTASASYVLPAATPPGTYTIQAVYNGTANFLGSTDTSQSLTFSQASTSTAAASTLTKFSTASHTVSLAATVTSAAGTVNEGTETFSILSGTTVIGSAVTVSVKNGAASAGYSLPAATSIGTYTLKAVYNGTADYLGSTDTSQSLTVSQATTSTAAASTLTLFSLASQTVPLSATVMSAPSTVDEGTETFSILSGTTVIGSAVTVDVGNGTASASYVLPGGTPPGAYTIQAVYNGTADFLGSTDTSQSLSVSQATTSTAAASISATFSPASQTVPLSATVTSAAGTVDDGTETFTILSGATVIGAAVTVNVENGTASASYVLPAATPRGAYIIQADYNGTADFDGSTDTSHFLSVSQATTSTAAASTSTTFSTASQTVPLSATVTSAAGTVNVGTEAFSILSGTTVVGSAVTVNVVNGVASASYVLPPATSLGTYTIQADYNGTADFLGSTDTSHSLTVSQATTSTAAASTSTTFSSASQTVSLIATVTSPPGTVDEGTETFSILSGTTVIGSAVTVNVVNGTASASYVLPGATPQGTYTIQAVYNGTADFLGSTDLSHTLTVSQAKPSQLSIQIEPPSNATAGQVFSQSIVVDEEDQYGNIETNDNSTVVTVSLASGNGTLQGTKSVTLEGGMATFADLSDTKAETISLQFSAAGVAPGLSTSITISPAAAYQLLIHTQPSQTATAGQPFATQPVIDEVDRYGNLESGDNSTGITVSLATGNGPLRGTTTVTESGGIATFTDLADNRAGVISLNFAGLGLTAGPSSNVFISPAATAQLVIQTPPFANVTAGNPLTDPIVIDEEDQYGNVETGDNSTVITASLASGRGPLNGTTAATVSRGVATFNALEDDTAGTLSLKFTSGAHFSVVANATDVAAAPATQLVVTTPPPTTLSAGQAFDITISAEDQFGNLDTSYSQAVTISVPGGPGFTTAVQAKNGVAAFVGLTLPASAHAVTIQATATGLSGAATNPIPVISPAPTIIGESVLKLQKTNKKGKPVGKPAFAGFEIDFSAPMNPSTTGNSANYQVESTSIKRVKKKTGPVYKPVAFRAAYHQTTDVNSVILTIKKAAPFAKGGRITIINTPPNGVSSAGGAPLATVDTDLNISPKAKVIKIS
jgi:hypothetical protein